MILHSDELALARAYNHAHAEFPGLTDQQMKLIMDRGRQHYKWFKENRVLHNLINVGVLLFTFGADFLTAFWLPRLFLVPAAENPLLNVLAAACLAGLIRGYLFYSLGVFSLHEGAAHNIVFVGNGPLIRLAQFVARNVCRCFGAEPVQYSASHMAHHAKFGTEGDAEFLNFVRPRRYWPTFLPFSAIINYSDFVAHRPLGYTKSRLISLLAALVFHGTFAWFLSQLWGGLFVVVMLVVMIQGGILLDRARQYTEHNLMPLENKNGSRSFGVGFWGLLIGGGPWGSPCHWEHHLVASIPWYQQIQLHRYLVGILTPEQKKQFLLEPVVGFPKLWWRLIREPNRFERSHPEAARAAAASDSH